MREGTLSGTARRLKQRTRAVHERVEAGLGLLDGQLSLARVSAVLERFHGFWAATEPLLDAWARRGPEPDGSAIAARLDWPRRRRCPALAHDLLRLGADPFGLPLAPPVFDQVGTAEALGWLYVSEGSSLGGAVIHRRLRAYNALAVPDLRFFVPYPEGPGPMWRQLIDTVDAWVAEEPGRGPDVERSAVAVFEGLAAWLEPVLRVAAT